LIITSTISPGIKAFSGYLHHEGFIETNPMGKVKMPKVPEMVVPREQIHPTVI